MPRNGVISTHATQDAFGMVCVLNPAAGAFRDPALERAIRHEMQTRSIPVIGTSLHGIDHPGLGADPGIRTVIACGGDGTVNRVVNAMDLDRQRLAVIPAGRGNSLARDLGLGRLDRAIASLRTGSDLRIDAMKVLFRRKKGDEADVLAVNAVGFGVLPDVVQAARRTSRAGAIGYAFSTLLNRTRATRYEVAVDDVKLRVAPHVGAIALNTRHLSIHRPCADARPDDGVLDLLLLPSGFAAEKLAEVTMIAGFRAVGVDHRPSRELQIALPDPQLLYIDGEVVEDVTGVQVRILPAAITALGEVRGQGRDQTRLGSKSS
jgi:diacylglycerol kinase family enzyme